MNEKEIVEQFLEFLGSSSTQFHATGNVVEKLNSAGFKELAETDRWNIKKGGKYYVVRNQSSIIAFQTSDNSMETLGYRIIGAHTDSPGLKINPNPEYESKSYLSLGVEVYGRPILPTWFDRDLSIAGKISYSTRDAKLSSTLVDFQKPIAIIPSLAVHLSKKDDEISKLKIQKEMLPIVMQSENGLKKKEFNKILLDQMAESDKSNCKEILGYDLFLYDIQKPNRLGLRDEFVVGGRIDNLLSCFCGLQAILNCSPAMNTMIVLNDHEEIGSQSYVGAGGNFLFSILDRLSSNKDEFYRNLANSVLLSIDNAHGVHPNYIDKHDPNHMPILNRGPVVKINAKHRYSTTGETEALFNDLCNQLKIPRQTFINHPDIACGSTIGPMTSAKLGLKSMDIGVPTFAMHSIRETCGVADIKYMYQLAKSFLELHFIPAVRSVDQKR